MQLKSALFAATFFTALPVAWAATAAPQIVAQAQSALTSKAIVTNVQQPQTGMTIAQLHQTMGQPTQVDTTTLNGAEHQRLTYQNQGQPVYVYTRNGVVTFIQRY